MGVPGLLADDDFPAREPGLARDFNALLAPAAMGFVAQFQLEELIPRRQPARALQAHAFHQVAFLLALVLVPILEMERVVEAVSGAVRGRFGNPYHVHFGRFAALFTYPAWSLVTSMSVRAYPIEGVQVAHSWHQRPIRLHVRQQFHVEALVESAMRIH